MNEQEWIEKPEALGLLVQQTVRHLIQQRPDKSEQEGQLREVSRTVERLEKMGLSVPEELRRLKTNLVVQTDQDTDFDRQLKTLGESLAEALGMIEEAIGPLLMEEKKNETLSNLKRHRRRNSGLKTTYDVLNNYVFKALTELGGSAHCSQVLERMQELFQDKWLPGDMEPHKVYETIWQYKAHWAYQKLIHEGIALRSSQRGYWELNPDAIKKNGETKND